MRRQGRRTPRDTWFRGTNQLPGPGWVLDDHLYYASDAWKATRFEVLERDDFTCQYCGNPATCVDHVLPRMRGGGDDLDNLKAACAHCNATAGALVFESFPHKKEWLAEQP
jgi:5-methylcytosine-specific restriction endonuclease McrA